MELVIAEKPSVAQSIAQVLGAADRKDGCMEGNGYIVSWCIGHLVELAPPESYSDAWKRWDYAALPMIPSAWQYEVKSDTAAQYQILSNLMHDARVDSVVCATDAGREGELIFRLVYAQAGCSKPIKRLWLQSMEEKAIMDGFENLKPGSDYDHLYEAALCRQEADWLVGLNGTRLFTVLYGGKVLKVGRVQTPTLAMLAERERSISEFKKEKYYTVRIIADGIEAVGEKISSKDEAERVAGECQGRNADVARAEKEKKTAAPPKLYDLTTLQRDANRILGFTAKQTLEYTQSLYEKKLVTYPRTDSQYLSDDMGQTAQDVIDAVSHVLPFAEGQDCAPDISGIMDSSKVTDHHAIIPTVEIALCDIDALPEAERRTLFLIACRLLCATGEKHEYESYRVELSCAGHTFKAQGKAVTNEGWKRFDVAMRSYFRAKAETDGEEMGTSGQNVQKLSEGQVIENVDAKVAEQETKPPKHFTEDSLLSAMERAGVEDMGNDVERKGLGTPATRADIIEKLVKDGFVKREKKQLIATEDGIKLISILPAEVKTPKLTAEWENTLAQVANGECPMEEFMSGIERMVKDMVLSNSSVGEDKKDLFKRAGEVLGKCPKCGSEILKGKFGAYCSGKCGMSVGRAMGTVLTDTQIKSLLNGKKTLVKGLKGKKGSYDAYLIPDGIEDYSYEKDGKVIKGSQYRMKLEFPQKKGR